MGAAGARDDGGSDAAVGIGLVGLPADGSPFDKAHGGPFDNAHGGQGVPATSKNLKGSGWDSVVVEELDVVAFVGGICRRGALLLRAAATVRRRLRLGSKTKWPPHEDKSSDPEEGGTNAERGGEVTQEGRADGGDLGAR